MTPSGGGLKKKKKREKKITDGACFSYPFHPPGDVTLIARKRYRSDWMVRGSPVPGIAWIIPVTGEIHGSVELSQRHERSKETIHKQIGSSGREGGVCRYVHPECLKVHASVWM